MNYTEITETALAYADREDAELTSLMSKFLFVVESRINKKLKVAGMSARAEIDLTLADLNQEVFAMPPDFGGLRSIKIVGDEQRTMTYVNPEQLANRISKGSVGAENARIYYNMVAKELHLYPPQNIGELEITYYQKVDPLTVANPNNWISDDEPECYIFGLLVEISAFAKDVDSVNIWEKRFIDCIEDIKSDDMQTRWSGTSLQIHVG